MAMWGWWGVNKPFEVAYNHSNQNLQPTSLILKCLEQFKRRVSRFRRMCYFHSIPRSVQDRKKKTVSKQIFITILHVDGSLCKE